MELLGEDELRLLLASFQNIGKSQHTGMPGLCVKGVLGTICRVVVCVVFLYLNYGLKVHRVQPQ